MAHKENDETSKPDEVKQDYPYNYHIAEPTLRRQSGPNLNEATAETVDLIYGSINRDCVKEEKHDHRTSSKDQDQ